MPNERYALAIDAGGTTFKSAVVESSGAIASGSEGRFPVDSAGDRETLLGVYGDVIGAARDYAEDRGILLEAIGVSTPGPFDYAYATSLMRHKFASLFGLDLKKAWADCGFIPPDMPVRFMHDTHAFLIGEHRSGAARGYANAAAVTIGTGIGFGVMRNNRLMPGEQGGPCISVYRLPCEGGTLEDVVSGRGIARAYVRLGGIVAPAGLDAREIARLAIEERDPHAAMAYGLAGRELAVALAPILERLGCSCLVVGGQVAKAFALMEDELRHGLNPIRGLERICAGANIDTAALIGAVSGMLDSGSKPEK